MAQRERMNDTIIKFGYPDTLITEYRHWLVLLRPVQPTLGSLVIAAKSDATAFGSLPPEYHAELGIVTADVERVLARTVHYERINYLMLMMVDPYVHFHVIPRYDGTRSFAGREYADAGWPKPPELGAAVHLDATGISELANLLKSGWE